MLVYVEKAYWPYVLYRFFCGSIKYEKSFWAINFERLIYLVGGLGLRSGVLGFVVQVEDGDGGLGR